MPFFSLFFSQNGKKLITRCRTLIAENQELGKQLSQGKTAQLEAELALQKKYSKELKVSQNGENLYRFSEPFFLRVSFFLVSMNLLHILYEC